MRADKRCKNCEWWDPLPVEEPKSGLVIARCLRWPGEPWLETYDIDRCWQWAKRMKESEILSEDLERLADPEKPIGLVRTQDIEEVDKMMPIDDITSSLAHARLRLTLARRLITAVFQEGWASGDWSKNATAWLNVKD